MTLRRAGEVLQRDGTEIVYRVSGSGPALLAPECNFTWTESVQAALAEHFTLIVASPRDFGASTRTGGPRYDVQAWADDLQAVVRHVGFERFVYFGYSFTGAFGPWLARRLRDSAAVVAVASGDFPLLGDYAVTLADVETQSRALAAQPEAWARISSGLERRGVLFDLHAGYDHEALNDDLDVALPPAIDWLLTEAGGARH